MHGMDLAKPKMSCRGRWAMQQLRVSVTIDGHRTRRRITTDIFLQRALASECAPITGRISSSEDESNRLAAPNTNFAAERAKYRCKCRLYDIHASADGISNWGAHEVFK